MARQSQSIEHVLSIATTLLPDLFVNVIGVFLGGLAAFVIARWQMNRQSKDNENVDLEMTDILMQRIKLELRDNRNVLNKLLEAMNRSRNARVDMWNWLIAITGSLSFFSYHNLVNLGLQRKLPKNIELELFSSYQMLESLINMIKEGGAALHFFYGNSGDEESANQFYDNVRIYSRTVYDHLNTHTVALIYKYVDETKTKK